MGVLYFVLTEHEKFSFRHLSAEHNLILNMHFWVETNYNTVFFAVVLVLLDNGLNRLVFVFTDA